MLRKEIIEELQTKIKEINREKSYDTRLENMIDLLDRTRGQINDELDDIFSQVDLKKTKINLE